MTLVAGVGFSTQARNVLVRDARAAGMALIYQEPTLHPDEAGLNGGER